LTLLEEIEISFHQSAFDFSENVLKNMDKTGKRSFRMSVEETLYPPHHREALLNHMGVFEDSGVYHLKLKEPRVFIPGWPGR